MSVYLPHKRQKSKNLILVWFALNFLFMEEMSDSKGATVIFENNILWDFQTNNYENQDFVKGLIRLSVKILNKNHQKSPKTSFFETVIFLHASWMRPQLNQLIEWV